MTAADEITMIQNALRESMRKADDHRRRRDAALVELEKMRSANVRLNKSLQLATAVNEELRARIRYLEQAREARHG